MCGERGGEEVGVVVVRRAFCPALAACVAWGSSAFSSSSVSPAESDE